MAAPFSRRFAAPPGRVHALHATAARRGRCAIVVGVALSLGSCGAPPPDVRVEAIVNGSPEAASPWVVMVVQPVPGTTRVRLCSGAVVAPRAVLTAKHCVYRSVTGSATWAAVPASELTVRTGVNFRSPERTLAVTAIRTTEGPYRDDDGRTGGDIAVLTLAEALDATPKRLSRTPAAVGDRVRIVGFGYTQPGATDPADLGGLHRGEATVQSLEANVFSTTGAQWTCTGDSGGPALHTGRDELVGVVSIGPAGCRVSTSYYTRVDRYLALFEGLVDLPPGADAGASPDAAVTTDASTADGGGGDVASAPPASADGGCAAAPRGGVGRPWWGALAGALLVYGRRKRLARRRGAVRGWSG